MAFYVGQKVVCVDDNSRSSEYLLKEGERFNGNMDGLTAGQVYTVRHVGVFEDVGVSRYEGLRLFEIERGINTSGYEQPYLAARFRPAAERKTDISIFKAMLNPADKRVEA